MKMPVMSLLVSMTISLPAFAQSTLNARLAKDAYASRGVRVSVLRPVLSAKLNASSLGENFDSSENLDSTMGFSVGYASLPLEDFGWTTSLSFLEIQNEGTTTNMARIDGNLSYPLSRVLSIRGGVNLAKFVGAEEANRMTPELGFQAGLGLQITKTFGLDVNYVRMAQSGRFVDDVRVRIVESGAELGLTATF